MNRNKRDRYKSQILAIIKHEQLILAQGEDSKKGQLIYLMQKGSFQVILYKMIRFLSGKLKKQMKLAKIVKISEIFNRLVFPLNFNRFCHPMTLVPTPMRLALFLPCRKSWIRPCVAYRLVKYPTYSLHPLFVGVSLQFPPSDFCFSMLSQFVHLPHPSPDDHRDHRKYEHVRKICLDTLRQRQEKIHL